MKVNACKICGEIPEVEECSFGFRIACEVDKVHHVIDMWEFDKEELIRQWNELMR